MEPNDKYTPIDTPIQRINEDKLSDILGDLIAEAAAPIFDEAFEMHAEKVVKSAELLADLIAERLKR